MKKRLHNIVSVAKALGIRRDELETCGPYKAKVDLGALERLKPKTNAKYILVSAITPTPLGEGKTVTTIGLSMALDRLNYKSVCTLRQSSAGVLFGSKGPATGGGASRVLPEDEINLHLTGDTHAIGLANNLLVSFIENSIFHGNRLNIDPHSISVKRCLDVTDRALRHIRYSLKAGDQKFDISTGFEMTASSEVMSIITLSRDRQDMHRRLKDMVVARTYQGSVVTVGDLKAHGMMAAVLRDALKPNLVQTSEGTPCLIHTGPFANVSVGSSSVIADRMALSLSDYVVTESGFGADCGAEKFFDIKCRASGFKPHACVLVCSVRGIKAQSGKFFFAPGQKIPAGIFKEDLQALEEGIVNLKKQIQNVRQFSIPVIVALNIFSTDTKKEIKFIQNAAVQAGAQDCLESTVYQDGSPGAVRLAQSIIRHTRSKKSTFEFLYESQISLKEKIEVIARKIYGARGVEFLPQAAAAIDFYTSKDFGALPVCIAKTQFSLSHDESLKGAPTDFVLPIHDVLLYSGAGFILAHTSLIQTMPGLPLEPKGTKIAVSQKGQIIGLS